MSSAPLSVLILAALAFGAQPPSVRPRLLQAGDGDRLVRRVGPTRGWPYTIKLDAMSGATTDFVVMTETMGPGQSIPFHKHDNAEEIVLFDEGGAEATVGDQHGVAGPHAIVFIPRDTWISATNTSTHDVHLTAIFSRPGFERYMRAISVAEGQPLTPLDAAELPRLRALGHATYWDVTQGPYPPGTAHP